MFFYKYDMAVLEANRGVTHIVFKNAERVRSTSDVGMTVDGRVIVLQKDRTGRVIGIEFQ